MPAPTPAVTGTPSHVGDEDPVALVRQARGQDKQFSLVIDRSPDDSYSRGEGHSPYTYFEPARDKTYRNTRHVLPVRVDYLGATDVVERARQLRDGLNKAKLAAARAAGAIKAAEAQDRRESIAAEADGREHRPTHAKAARAELERADRAAAVALHRAVAVEDELRDALAEHAWPIRNTMQDTLDAEAAAIERILADAEMRANERNEAERDLGLFERAVLAPLVDPGDWLDLRPAGAGTRWHAGPGSPHAQAVRDLLAEGRRPQRVPTQHFDILRRWVDSRPLPTLVRPDKIRSATEPRPEQPGDAA